MQLNSDGGRGVLKVLPYCGETQLVFARDLAASIDRRTDAATEVLVAQPEVQPKATLYGAVRFLTVFGTLAILAALALYLLSHSFQAGVPVGIRSLAAILLPILAGSFVFVVRRSSLRRISEAPVGVAFSGSLLAGALIMAALRFLVHFSPIPVAELLIAACISVLVFASDSVARLAFDGPQSSEDRPLSLFYGVASGMLLYVVLFGFPRIGGA